MNEPRNTMDSALEYAALNLPVFPIHTIVDRRCTCGGKPGCSPGKHPRLRHGFKAGCTDQAQIRQWWARWPTSNIGIPTGAVSGWIVVDIDPRNGGDMSLDELVVRHGRMPETVEALTGGGGRHLVYAHPGFPVRCRSGLLPGIDIKGDGGYVVVDPSMHQSGRQYAWELSHRFGEVDIARPPEWLLESLREDGPAQQMMTERTETTEGYRDTESYLPAARNDSVLSVVSVSSVLSVLSGLSVTSETAKLVVHAIEATVPRGLGKRNDAVFNFARHLKGLRDLASAPLSQLKPIVRFWHQVAYPRIGTKPFDDTWADFIRAYPLVKHPKGGDRMALVHAKAESMTAPSWASEYDCPITVQLIKICIQLQAEAGDGPFYLACRTAGHCLGVDHQLAAKRLNLLVAEGVLKIESEHTDYAARRYRLVKRDSV